jgi:penicillin-binding protein 1A
MDPRLQAAAERAVREGLEAVDRRQGYRGALGTLEPGRFETLKGRLEARLQEAGRRRPDEELVADLRPLAVPAKASAPEEGAEETPAEAPEGEAPAAADELLARRVPLRPLDEGLRLVGYVRSAEDKRAVVELVGRQGELTLPSVAWARRRGKGGKLSAAPRKVSDAVAAGELVAVRVVKAPPAPAPLQLQLDQEPSVEGALALIDGRTRHVAALVGGYDTARSAFNRATQARRQPGSSFKPFVYGAALESHRFTPASVVNDAPEAVRDDRGKVWKPQNFEKDAYEGQVTVRAALTRSKNTVSVRLLEAIGTQAAIDFARRAGIRSPLPDNLTLALGSGEVGVLEEANAYATLQAGGRHAEPLMLLQVRDADGKVLEAHQASFEQAIDPAVAYLTTSLMKSVVEEGTAVAVKELGRPAAGKTGTASESRDAWFSGYTAHWVATAWVGFDDHEPLGPGETGGRAALPLWLSAMREAERGLPVEDFEPPKGLLSVTIDPATGLLAPEGEGREELFLEGTQPTEQAPPSGTARPEDFFLQEGQ